MNGFSHRAIMLDSARVMESKNYYRDMLPWLQEWGYNVLHLHFTDDQGSGLVFPSHPELAKDGAFTAQEMRSFVEEADAHGLTVIPELECLGHTKFITSKPEYAHLGGDDSGIFNAVDPENENTRQLLWTLLNDIADIFKSDIIHVGLDEVNLACLPRYRDLQPSEHWRVFADHAVRVHDMVRQLNRRPAMWGDHVLSSPEMIKKFTQDLLIFDWHYKRRVDPASLKFFCEHGMEVWGAPATSSGLHTRGIPNSGNLDNVRHFSAVAAQWRKQGVNGMLNTVWCPWRYLPGGADWPMALAAHLFSSEMEDDRHPVMFAEKFYGLNAQDAETVGQNLARLHDIAPGRAACDRILHGGSETDPLTREDARQGRQIGSAAEQIIETLSLFQSTVKQNYGRFDDLLISARLVRELGAAAAGDEATRGEQREKLFTDAQTAWQRERYQTWDSENVVSRPDNIIEMAKELVRRS